MKCINKIIILILIIFLFPLSLRSQEKKQIPIPKHNIYGGYGVGTIPDMANMFEGLASVMVTLGYSQIKDKNYSGSFFIGYSNNLTEQFALDLKVGYQSYTSIIYNSGIKVGNQNDNYYTFIAGFNIQYSNKNFFRTYSGLDVGIFFDHQKEIYNGKEKEKNRTYLGYQVTVFGLRAGGNVGGFIELGIGYMGILSGGISAMF
jgi:hypothetical protein